MPAKPLGLQRLLHLGLLRFGKPLLLGLDLGLVQGQQELVLVESLNRHANWLGFQLDGWVKRKHWLETSV